MEKNQEICCQNKISKLSDYMIDDDITTLMITFSKEDSTFNMDTFINIPQYLNQIEIYAKFINNKCSGNLIGNIYEALRPAISLKHLNLTIKTDNTNWNNFDKLTLEYISMHYHENVHNQIVFPVSSKYVVFNAFQFTINNSPQLCKNYMMKAFKNKPIDVQWEWSVNCNYNPHYKEIFCLIDKTYKIRMNGTN